VRPLRRAPLLVLALSGALAAFAVVVGGQPPTLRKQPGTARWPFLDSHTQPGWIRNAGPVLALLGAGVLCLAWLWLLHAAHRGALSLRTASGLSITWALPLLVGPPVLSGDAYTYLAIGQLVRRGLDPYRVGVRALGASPLLQSVDPRWRGVRTPYGPLDLGVDRLAAHFSAGSVVWGVVLLRALAVLGVVLLVAASLLRSRADRVVLVVLLGANPLVLLHLIGGAHVDAMVAGLLALALLADRAGRPALAVAVAVAAGMFKAPAFLAVAVLIAHHVVQPAPNRRWLTLLRDMAAAALATAVYSLTVPDGFGWLHALATPGRAHTLDAPTNAAASLLSKLTGLAGPTALSAGRIAGALCAIAVIAFLLVTVRRRGAARTTGYALLAETAGAPVFYVWYLGLPLACLAPSAGRRTVAGLAFLSVAGSLTSLPSLGNSPVRFLVLALLAVLTLAATLLTRLGSRAP